METATLPPAIDPARRRRGLLLSIVEGMSAQAHASLTGNGGGGPNAITVGLALLLGAGDPGLGLLAALPLLGNVGQIVGAALDARSGRRKPIVVIASTISRWIVMGATPLVFLLAEDRRLAVFLALWAIANALISLGAVEWVSWMADLCPPPLRGRYFSRRNLFCQLVAIAAPLGASYILDRWFGGVPRTGALDGLEGLRARGFTLAFGAASFFGLLSGVLLTIQPEPARPPLPAWERLGASAFLEPFRDRRFWPLLLFVGVFGATNGIAAPFWTPFMLEELKLDYTFVNGTYVALQGGAVVVSLLYWGKLSDRMGHRFVVALALGLIASHPLYYVFASSPERWYLMLADAVSSGVAWAGYNLAIFNLALALAPRRGREAYYAIFTAILGAAQAATSIAAGAYLSRLPASLPLAGLELDPRQQVFLATHVARLGCLVFFLVAVEDSGSRRTQTITAAVQAYVKNRYEALKFLVRDE
jgi:MFS family permease